jgi:hypothetical protein
VKWLVNGKVEQFIVSFNIISRHGNYRHIRFIRASNVSGDLVAIHARHNYIGKDHIEIMDGVEHLNPLFAIAGGPHFIPQFGEKGLKGGNNDIFIVNNQDLTHHTSKLAYGLKTFLKAKFQQESCHFVWLKYVERSQTLNASICERQRVKIAGKCNN